MARLFEAGFEPGDFSEFTSVVQISAIAEVLAVDPAHGAYHGRFALAGVADYERAGARQNIGIPTSTIISARAYVKLLSGGTYWIICLDDSNAALIFRAGIHADGTWRVMVNGTHGASTVIAELNRLYCVELYVFRDPLNGEVIMYVDGTPVVSLTGLDTQIIGTDWFHVTVGAESSAINPVEVYVDSLVVAEEYIGPEVIPPPPCETYLTQEECEAAGCFWYDGLCHSSPPPPPPDMMRHLLTVGSSAAGALLIALGLLK